MKIQILPKNFNLLKRFENPEQLIDKIGDDIKGHPLVKLAIKDLENLKVRFDQVEVKGNDSRLKAIELMGDIKKHEKAIENLIDDPVKKAHKIHKALKGFQNYYVGLFSPLTADLKNEIQTYDIEQARLKRIEDDKAETERIQAEAEARQIIAEEAAMLEAAGDTMAADAKLKEKEFVFIPPVETPKEENKTRTASGSLTGYKEVEIEVENRIEFLKFALNNSEYSDFVIVGPGLKAHIKRKFKNDKSLEIPGLSIKEVQKSKFGI